MSRCSCYLTSLSSGHCVALSNLRPLSLPLCVSHPQVPQVVSLMCLILKVFHPFRKHTERHIYRLETANWEHAPCVFPSPEGIFRSLQAKHVFSVFVHVRAALSTLPYMAVPAGTCCKLVRRDSFEELRILFLFRRLYCHVSPCFRTS